MAPLTPGPQTRGMNEATDETRLLRAALLSNAAFSTLCAGTLLLDAGPVSTWMGLGSAVPLYVVGAALVPFAVGLVINARREQVNLGEAVMASLGDAAWVIGSLVLMIGWPEWFSTAGLGAIAGVAAFVATFGIAQVAGIRRILRNANGRGSALAFERVVDASPARVWDVISDVHDYAQYAPSLDFSRIVSGHGEGAIRECGDATGRWNEVCTGWDEGREYRFEVDTRADDYPYPFEELRGQWGVDPVDGGSRIRMRFELVMPYGIVGELMLAAMSGRFRKVGEAVLDNWQQAIERPPLARAA